MGLDVYLYRHAQPLEVLDRLEEEAEQRGKVIHAEVLREYGAESFDKLATNLHGDYFAACQTRYAAAGLDEHGGLAESDDNRKIEQPSAKHPEHYFKLGYFRSSYNASGINNVLRRAGLELLGDVFEAGDRYRFTPDWRGSLARARRLRDAYAAHLERSGGVDVMLVDSNPFTKPEDLCSGEKDALDMFLKQREGHRPGPGGSFSSYSMRDGEFFMGDPVKVRAFIHGKHDGWSGVRPCTYVVYERDAGEDWHAQALDIVVETIEWVLAQPDPEHYALHWSG